MPIPEFRSLTMWMNVAIFAAAAVVVWIGTKLATSVAYSAGLVGLYFLR